MIMSLERQCSKSDHPLTITDIIGKKRDGQQLNDEEIEFFVQGVVDGTIQDSQMGELKRKICSDIISLKSDGLCCFTALFTFF